MRRESPVFASSVKEPQAALSGISPLPEGKVSCQARQQALAVKLRRPSRARGPAADVPTPAPSLVPRSASAGAPDTLRQQPLSAAIAQEGTRAQPPSAGTITGLPEALAAGETAATAEPKAAAPVAPAPQELVGAYLRVCRPEHFPEPGPVDAEEYDRAVSFEVALNVLRRIRDWDGEKVLRPWQRWHEHHGNLKAGEQAAALLQNLAGYMKVNLLTPPKWLRRKASA